jgi:type IV pilus assembly protein PilC
MPTYKYVVKDESARTITGKLVADNQDIIVEELRKRKATIISIKELKEAQVFGGLRIGRPRVGLDDLVVFSRQLATMVDAGIPLLQSLSVLQEQMENKELRRILSIVSKDIETGNSLSTALSKHPSVFSDLYINMVKAGESSGMLNEILERMASYFEKVSALRRKVRTAMVYPAVVITMAIAITTFLMIKVVPTFSGIFDLLGGELPLPTKILIFVSNLVRKTFLIVIVSLIVFFSALARYIRTERGKLIFHRLELKLPILGELFRKVAVSKFSRTLATLVQSGVPILVSLEIVGKTSGNKVVEIAIENVRTNVREGESIAAPLGKSGVFPPMVVRMIAVGEQTGELGKMLGKISQFYDEQVDAAVAGLTSMIEPLIIGFLGIVVGSIVVALFLPILKITQLIGR